MNFFPVEQGRIINCPGMPQINGNGWIATSDKGFVFFRRIDFDSQTLGIEAVWLQAFQFPRADPVGFLRQVIRLAAERVDHITWKIPAARKADCTIACEAGFSYILTNQTFSGPLIRGEIPDGLTVRQALPSDHDALINLCITAFNSGTRYHRDQTLPAKRVPKLYRHWMRNSLNGYADTVFLSETEKIDGFLTVRQNAGNTIYIDLLGVHPVRQRYGIGKALLTGLGNNSGESIRSMSTDTEQDNASAVAFYTAMGFKPKERTKIFQLGLNTWK